MSALANLPRSKRLLWAQNELIKQWLTGQCAPGSDAKWRSKVLPPDPEQAIAVKKYGAFYAPASEYWYAKQAADHMNMTQSDFLRLCVASFLLTQGYATQDQIPVMAKHAS